MNTLYRETILFVYPSLYESFGLPILESFKSECSILLSDIECFVKVAGDAALCFSKHNQQDLIKKIRYVIENPKVREELIIKGLERLKLVPFNTSIQKTLSLYNEIA